MMLRKLKQIVACGCSHSYGFCSKESVIFKTKSSIKDYNSIVAEELNSELVHLGKPGATNYMIAKQIEYSVKYNPDLVLVNITGPLRVSLVLDRADQLHSIPTLEKFDYDIYTNTYTDEFERRITTVPRTMLNLAKIKDPEHQLIVDYWNRYSDEYLLMDQDRLMIDSALSKLSDKNIPYICCDLSNMNMTDYIKNILLIPSLQVLLKEFSIANDPYHLNQQGHTYIANEIIKYIIENNMFK